jgi:hypothetical protein
MNTISTSAREVQKEAVEKTERLLKSLYRYSDGVSSQTSEKSRSKRKPNKNGSSSNKSQGFRAEDKKARLVRLITSLATQYAERSEQLTQRYESLTEDVALELPPLPLNRKQTKDLCEVLQGNKDDLYKALWDLLKREKNGWYEELKDEQDKQEKLLSRLLDLFHYRILPGVDDAAKVKAEFLKKIVQKKIESEFIKTPQEAISYLGEMKGGYNIEVLIWILRQSENEEFDKDHVECAVQALGRNTLVYDAFNDVVKLAESNPYARKVLYLGLEQIGLIDILTH